MKRWKTILAGAMTMMMSVSGFVLMPMQAYAQVHTDGSVSLNPHIESSVPDERWQEAYEAGQKTDWSEIVKNAENKAKYVYYMGGVDDTDEYERSLAMESGQSFTGTYLQCNDFLDYYYDEYLLDSVNYRPMQLKIQGAGKSGDEDLYTITPISPHTPNQEQLVEDVIAYYGIRTYDDPIQTIEETYRRVHEKTKYETYQGSDYYSVEQTLQQGAGTCDQISRIARILLCAEGIPTKHCSGYRSLTHYGFHCWDECWLDGKWQVVDFSWEPEYGTDDVSYIFQDKTVFDYVETLPLNTMYTNAVRPAAVY